MYMTHFTIVTKQFMTQLSSLKFLLVRITYIPNVISSYSVSESGPDSGVESGSGENGYSFET